MAATPRRRRLSAQRRHALQLLASSQTGITETFLFARGVTPHMLARLLNSGLATIQRAPVKSADGRVMITDAGRRALEGANSRRSSSRSPEAG
jgi:hypothetical protein